MQTTRAQPKRKRAEVSYYESSDDSEEDSKKKVKTSNKTISTRPLPKKKIFSFNSLPAELKNQIYSIALTNPDGVFLISKTRQYRRVVKRETPNSIQSSEHSCRYRNRFYNRQQSQPLYSSSTPAKLPALVTNILLLNREIYAEAQPILYASNAFAVEDTTALHAFLANIGPKNCATIADVTISGWGYTKAHKALNHPAFTLLANAVNLTRLHIDCRISWSGPKHAARQLYRDGFHWLEAMGVAKGNFDAAVGIIEIQEIHGDNFNQYYRYGVEPKEKPTEEELLEEFRGELRKLLRQN